MNELLDNIEDNENESTDPVDIILHQPGEGDGSEEEDGDEDQPLFQNLPGTLLNAVVETHDEEKEDTKPPSKRQKKVTQWTDPPEDLSEVPVEQKQKAVGFENCNDPVDFFSEVFL